jgi:cell division protein ZapA (FtsZ GTPase activity inhibitor)
MKSVSVEVFGHQLVVRSDSGEEWVRALAASVEKRMRRVRAANQGASSVNVAITAALDICDELERLKIEHKELIERIESIDRRLSVAMEDVAVEGFPLARPNGAADEPPG